MNLLEASACPTDGLIRLRPPEIDDAAELDAAIRESLEALMPWMSWANPETNEAQALAWIIRCQESWQSDLAFEFVITTVQDGTILGACGLNNLNRMHRMANLGYWVRSSRHGQGIAPRAARLAARFGFEQVGLIRAEVVAAVGNTASQRAAEKAGAIREGILRNRMPVRDEIYDAVMFAFIPQDFEEEATP